MSLRWTCLQWMSWNLDGLGNMTNTPATASRGSTLAVQAANSSMMMQLSRVKKRRKMGTSRQGHTFWPVGASAREHARAGFEGSPFWVLRKACPSIQIATLYTKISPVGSVFRLQSGANAHSKHGKGQCHSNARQNQRQMSLQILLDPRRIHTG